MATEQVLLMMIQATGFQAKQLSADHVSYIFWPLFWTTWRIIMALDNPQTMKGATDEVKGDKREVDEKLNQVMECLANIPVDLPERRKLCPKCW